MTSAHGWADGRIFQKECRSLANAGYDVIELTNEEKDAVEDGVYVRGLGTCRNRLHRMTTKMFVMAVHAFWLSADIYHFHDPDLLLPGLLLRAFNKRVIYDIHEDMPRTVLYKYYIPVRLRVPLMRLTELIENTAARAMSGLVAATPAIADRFHGLNGNTVIVNNFPILARRAHTGRVDWSQRSFSVAYIGGIAEERGIGEILSAMEHLQHTKATLELAGRFSYPALEKELTRRPSWRSVSFRGMLKPAGILELLGTVRAGLAILHPQSNYLASQPTKLFEYMSAGIPVIASDFPLLRRIVEDTGCGLLVDPFDPTSIAEAIFYLLTHDAEAEAMGQRGRAAVERQYNWTVEEGTLLNLYSSLTDSGRTKRPAINSKY